ncbi:MAG: hypothetical protein INF89_18370 [Roseomonas sp.]|nr:hypothetical protein [Roseomonas sp.]
MMIESLTRRRVDGSFVGIVNGNPYHIVDGDALYGQAQEIAGQMGDELPFEDSTDYVSPAPSAPIILTSRQLFAALALTGFVTEAEALAAGRAGVVPAAIDAVFAELPAQDAFLARLTWATMREVPRDHPLISAMIGASLATSEQVDGIFALGSSLP